MLRREFLATGAAAVVLPLAKLTAFAAERRLLYIAVPGIRNYVEYGGVGVLVYDIGRGYTFVKRIPTWDVPEGQQPENVKGVAASARTGRLYVTTIKRTGCIDLLTEKMVWSKELEGGCDRLAISPDGQILYVPSLEGPHWNVVDAMSGDVITKVVTDSGAHNTVYSRRGDRVYLAGLRSPLLSIADTKTHKVVKTVGPFSAPIRPFTVNGSPDAVLRQRQRAARFRDRRSHDRPEAAPRRGPGLPAGPGEASRVSQPRHRPDAGRKRTVVVRRPQRAVHIFDNTVMPPRQTVTLPVRDQPGWVTFSIDGRHAYPSTGEVFETRTKKMIVALEDDARRQIGSEKLLEVVFDGDKPARNGDQFGMGMKR